MTWSKMAPPCATCFFFLNALQLNKLNFIFKRWKFWLPKCPFSFDSFARLREFFRFLKRNLLDRWSAWRRPRLLLSDDNGIFLAWLGTCWMLRQESCVGIDECQETDGFFREGKYLATVSFYWKWTLQGWDLTWSPKFFFQLNNNFNNFNF